MASLGPSLQVTVSDLPPESSSRPMLLIPCLNSHSAAGNHPDSRAFWIGKLIYQQRFSRADPHHGICFSITVERCRGGGQRRCWGGCWPDVGRDNCGHGAGRRAFWWGRKASGSGCQQQNDKPAARSLFRHPVEILVHSSGRYSSADTAGSLVSAPGIFPVPGG